MTDIENLPTLEEIAVTARPIDLACAVYFLFDRGELVYIGKAKNVHERVGQNLRDKQFDSYAYIHVEPARALLVEGIYIKKYKPKYNRHIPGGIGTASNPVYTNLKLVLAEFGITQDQLAGAIGQVSFRGSNKTLSLTAIAQIVNWDIWPSMTPTNEIMLQAENFLRKRGVPENRLRSLWWRSTDLVRAHQHDNGTESNGGPLCNDLNTVAS